ncbi:MAG TPA: DUF742 domain-containing protein [Thermomonospora sp.]|nr:DUF742 domain-containing protein [Thermomonospora sp.]
MTDHPGPPGTGDPPEETHRRPVRPYVITRGRSQPTRNTLRPETLLIATDPDRRLPPSAAVEQRRFLDVCRGLLSLSEAAEALRLPISVAAVVASDLVDAGHLTLRSNPPSSASDPTLLRALLDGLRRL